MFETKSGVVGIAGLFFFVFAFIVMGALPWTIYKDQPELTALQLAEKGIPHEFVDLAERFPQQFREYYGEPTTEAFAEAITLGRDVFVGEACWHCHSQFVRPVSREDIRWGPIAHAREYNNELQRPVLFGTRRVGPDLSREAGRKSNDWHIAHFYKPTNVVPSSVMPSYPWLFDEHRVPNKKGMAIIAYVQWLGSWLDVYPDYEKPAKSAPGSTDEPTSVAEQGHDTEENA